MTLRKCVHIEVIILPLFPLGSVHMYIVNILIQSFHIIIQKPSQLFHGTEIFFDLPILSLELVNLPNFGTHHGFLSNFVVLLIWNVDFVKVGGSYVINKIIYGLIMGFVEMLELIK